MTAPRADLDELGRLLAAATPGPWEAVNCEPRTATDRKVFGNYTVIAAGSKELAIVRGGWTDPEVEPTDAELVAALVNAAPALLAEVAELRETVARVREFAGYCAEDPSEGRLWISNRLTAALDGAQ